MQIRNNKHLKIAASLFFYVRKKQANKKITTSKNQGSLLEKRCAKSAQKSAQIVEKV